LRVVASHGLGNQLFQYVFAHSLIDSNRNVSFENSPIFPQNYHYQLTEIQSLCHHLSFRKNFTINHNSIFGRSVYKLKISGLMSNYILGVKTSQIIREADLDKFTFNKDKYLLDGSNIILMGFWQHWGFVESEIDSAVSEISKFLQDLPVPKLLSTTGRKRLVVHVRRGNYLQRGLDQILGVVNPASYRSVIKSLLEKNPGLEVYTLTDDIDLINNTDYGPLFGHIINPNEVDVWQAIKLMSEADFVLAANSTLSWWGALLATMQGGKGFIPSKFHKNIDSGDAFFSPRLQLYEVEYL